MPYVVTQFQTWTYIINNLFVPIKIIIIIIIIIITNLIVNVFGHITKHLIITKFHNSHIIDQRF